MTVLGRGGHTGPAGRRGEEVRGQRRGAVTTGPVPSAPPEAGREAAPSDRFSGELGPGHRDPGLRPPGWELGQGGPGTLTQLEAGRRDEVAELTGSTPAAPALGPPRAAPLIPSAQQAPGRGGGTTGARTRDLGVCGGCWALGRLTLGCPGPRTGVSWDGRRSGGRPAKSPGTGRVVPLLGVLGRGSPVGMGPSRPPAERTSWACG